MNEQEREYYLMASRIRAALATENGRVLKIWLRAACYMDGPMNNAEIESAAQTQRISARRDLFLALEQIERDGTHVTDN